MGEYSVRFGANDIILQIGESVDVKTASIADIKSDSDSVVDKFLKDIEKDASFISMATEKCLIIVNDNHRSTPTGLLLEKLLPLFRVKPDFIVACGSHAPPGEAELKHIFGKCFEDCRKHIFIHDARLKDTYYLGKSSYGNDIHVNRLLENYTNIIMVNSIEPHYFAGFTGWRKSILPGVAAYDTIENNHKFALEPESRLLQLKGNKLSLEMIESLEMLLQKKHKLFFIQCVQDKDKDLYSLYFSEDCHAFFDGTEDSKKLHTFEIDKRYDIVIAVASPNLDQVLYQFAKPLAAAMEAVKPGGAIIFVSECGKGIGNDNFYKLLSSKDNPEDVKKVVREKYRLGYHQAYKLMDWMSSVDIYAYTSLDDSVIEDIFIKPVKNLQSLIDDLLVKEKNPSVLIMESASITVPLLKENQ